MSGARGLWPLPHSAQPGFFATMTDGGNMTPGTATSNGASAAFVGRGMSLKKLHPACFFRGGKSCTRRRQINLFGKKFLCE
jgi:hypothetical protein